MTDKRNKKARGWFKTVILTVLTAAALTGCANPVPENESSRPESSEAPAERADTGFVVTGPDSYDSADTAILVGRNDKEGTATFLNLDLGKNIPCPWTAPPGFMTNTGKAFPSAR